MKKKSLLGALLAALIISGLILVVTVHFGTAQSGTNVTGIITSDTTWTQANSPYILTGNVLVNNGVTLTIGAGATVNLGSYYIMINGTLQAIGNNTNPISFNGGQITFTQYSTNWNESTDTGCIIENAILNSTALTSSTTVKLDNDTINTGVTVESATIISNSTITGDVSGGILSGNTITGNVNSPTILNNTITGSVGVGVVASNNIIIGGITAQGSVIISNNIISASGDAVDVPSNFFQIGGYPIIENNIITNSTVGIDIGVFIRDWVGANIPLVQNNLIYNNGIGIRYGVNLQDPYSGPPTIIQNNTITQNGVGIQVNSADDYCELINNNIQGNTNYSLLQASSNDFNATYNWWGTTDAQAINQTIYDYKDDFTLGRVSFIPFLTAPNLQAPTYITASAGTGGSIVPSGYVSVNYGGGQSFTITANTGYHIVDVVVDNVSQGSVSSYTFTNVQAAHTIAASFAINTYAITVTQTANGQIAPGTSTVNYGGSQTFTITPNSGYYIASITTDAGSVTVTSPSGQTVSFTNVQATHTITATFALTSTPTPTPTPVPTAALTSAPTTTPSPTAAPSPTPTPTPSPTTVPATTDTGSTVDLTISGNVTSSQMFNVTIATNQSASTTTVSFTVTGESGTMGFGNITIPKSAVPYGTTPTIYIDGQQAANQGYTQDANNYYVWYTTSFSTHEVSIVFTTTAPSPSPTAQSSLPLEAIYGVAAAVAIVAIVAVVLVLRKSKKGKS